MPKKTFLITGGSGGIGAALAHKLVKASYTPLIVYKSNREKAEDLARAVDGEAIELNLIDLDAVDRVVTNLAANDAVLAGVVLGASAALKLTSFGHISEQDMENQWRVNVLGHQRLLAGLVRKVFSKRKQGIVVGILSDAMGTTEKANLTSLGAYITAKYGLQGLLAVLKAEQCWLDVITVSPNFTETGMLEAFDERFLEPLRSSGQISSPEVVGQEIVDRIALFGDR